VKHDDTTVYFFITFKKTNRASARSVDSVGRPDKSNEISEVRNCNVKKPPETYDVLVQDDSENARSG